MEFKTAPQSDSLTVNTVPGSLHCIVAFGGCALQMGLIPPFEFVRFLGTQFPRVSAMFIIDKHKCWYQKGVSGVSTDVDSTCTFLRNLVQGYKTVTFMGVSAGGYAAMLFGSLLQVQHVVAFIPRTLLVEESRYADLKDFINQSTKYSLVGDLSVEDVNDNHHFSQIARLPESPNIVVYPLKVVSMRQLCASGWVAALIRGHPLPQI